MRLPSSLFLTGSIGILWFILWALLANSTPATHPRISAVEKQYIESSLALENTTAKVKKKLNCVKSASVATVQ